MVNVTEMADIILIEKEPIKPKTTPSVKVRRVTLHFVFGCIHC